MNTRTALIILLALSIFVIGIGQVAVQNPAARTLSNRIELLEKRIEKLEAQVELLAGMVAKGGQLPRGNAPQAPAPQARPAVKPGPAPAESYAYELRWDRIVLEAARKQEFEEKFKIDGLRGKAEGTIESEATYDDRAVRVRGSFVNNTQIAQAFAFEIALGYTLDNSLVRQGEPRVLGRATVQTDVIPPGGSYLVYVDVPVSNIEKIKRIEIGNVRVTH